MAGFGGKYIARAAEIVMPKEKSPSNPLDFAAAIHTIDQGHRKDFNCKSRHLSGPAYQPHFLPQENMNNFLLSNEPFIRFGFFGAILVIMAAWELLAPRRILQTSKPAAGLTTWGLFLLTPCCFVFCFRFLPLM